MRKLGTFSRLTESAIAFPRRGMVFPSSHRRRLGFDNDCPESIIRRPKVTGRGTTVGFGINLVHRRGCQVSFHHTPAALPDTTVIIRHAKVGFLGITEGCQYTTVAFRGSKVSAPNTKARPKSARFPFKTAKFAIF
jgi:hypothetical protein